MRPLLTVLIFLLMTARGHAFDTPEALVNAVYVPYGVDTSNPDKDCGGQTGPDRGFRYTDKQGDRFIEPKLLRASRTDKDLDADPFIQGQDWCIVGWKQTTLNSSADKARVLVEFRNFDTQTRLTYDLVRSRNGWLIADLVSSDGSLRKSYKLK